MIVWQDSNQNAQAASRPLQFGSDCYYKGRSHAAEKSFHNLSVSQICACNDLKGHDVTQVTTREIIADDIHSTNSGSDDFDVSPDSTSDDKIILSFRHNDPDSPYNWSRVRLVLINLRCV